MRSRHERLEMRGMLEPERVDSIVAGCAILVSLMDIARAGHIVVSECGVLEEWRTGAHLQLEAMSEKSDSDSALTWAMSACELPPWVVELLIEVVPEWRNR